MNFVDDERGDEPVERKLLEDGVPSRILLPQILRRDVENNDLILVGVEVRQTVQQFVKVGVPEFVDVICLPPPCDVAGVTRESVTFRLFPPLMWVVVSAHPNACICIQMHAFACICLLV